MELYVHVPYCRQKCRYCDFASYPCREDSMPRYVDAVLAEGAHMAHHAAGQSLSTAFIGGGTPSVLPPALLERLLSGLHEHYAFPSGREFTSEANPGTLTRDWLRTAMAFGVNRLSLGMQAAQPELLRMLGRIHTHEDVVASVDLARHAGIENLSLDLMFGLPGQTRQMWLDTLQAALALEPQHLSCYGLIPEDGTPLKRDLDTGRLVLPDEEEERRMYDDTLDLLVRHGFEQYEISNFARPGYACRHNIGYWKQEAYIGLGASAASMLMEDRTELRTTNPAGIDAYIAMTEQCRWSEREFESVCGTDARFETMMLGLRMTAGVSAADFELRHGVTLDSCYGDALRSLAARGLVSKDHGYWKLTRRGMDVQNAVLLELMD